MNVLGGYQKINISTADLTASTLSVEGLSKACANANGKAVLVKMPDGTEAFGAVKETQSGYQLSVMGADSKVNLLEVDDTDDSFTIVEGDGVTGTITGGTTTPVTLTTDNSTANPYIVPADGYIRIENTSASVDNTTAVAIPYPDRSNALTLFWGIPAGSGGSSVRSRREAFFVKRGTPIAVVSQANTTNVVFIALETED